MPRAFLGSLELELLVAGAPTARGPVLAETWHPLDRWPTVPSKLAVVLEPALAKHPIRFVLPNVDAEAKATGATLRVADQSIEIHPPLGWSHGPPPPSGSIAEAHARVHAFLDAAYAGDVKTAHAQCSAWTTRNALEKAAQAIGKHGPENLPRKLEGQLHAKYQRVLVCNATFGTKGITAFVTVAPIDGAWWGSTD